MYDISETETDVLFRIRRKGRMCGRHISQQDLLRGVKPHLVGEYKKAINHLVKIGFLRRLKKQNRIDLCYPPSRREDIENILKASGRYPQFFSMKIVKK